MKEVKPIFLVEDDDIDARRTRQSLEELHVANPFVRATNGEEALAWLRNPANPAPLIILLDLEMPIMNGLEFLAVAKADPQLRRIPIVILTASRSEADKIASFDLSVAGYMLKPVDADQFVTILRMINIYWTLSETP